MWHITTTVEGTIHGRTERHPLYSWNPDLKAGLEESMEKAHAEMEADLVERGENDNAHYQVTTAVVHLLS